MKLGRIDDNAQFEEAVFRQCSGDVSKFKALVKGLSAGILLKDRWSASLRGHHQEVDA